MTRPDAAVRRFREGYNCAQAILSVYGPGAGLSEELALRLGSSLGGGLGNSGQLCGAVTGASLVVGLHRGHTAPGEEGGAASAALVRELQQRFKAAHASAKCRALIRRSIAEPAELQAAADAGAFRRCPDYVRTACEVLEDLLAAPA
jgi:C_GCAxxG_C_C family probable redox protein